MTEQNLTLSLVVTKKQFDDVAQRKTNKIVIPFSNYFMDKVDRVYGSDFFVHHAYSNEKSTKEGAKVLLLNGGSRGRRMLFELDYIYTAFHEDDPDVPEHYGCPDYVIILGDKIE